MEPNKVGRPPKEINQKSFENLCSIQCTEVEICDFFEVSSNTLNKWCKKTYGKNFCEVFKEKRSQGRISLRRKQWQLADRHAGMAIFLGKQYLGQKDEQKIEHAGEIKTTKKVEPDLSAFTDDELEQMREYAARITPPES